MSAIEYNTFSDFRSIVQNLVAPEDLAENLEDYFRDQVANGLADMQTFLPWLREFNVNFYQKGQINEFCSASIFDGPVGKITQLFAYKPGVDCAKYHYQKVSTAELDCWMERQRCLCPATDPPSSNIYDSPYCNYVINGEDACGVPYLTGEEDDCRFKRLDDDDRIFAVGPDYRIYAAPRFPCQYVLCLQWQGIRRKWLDSDLVPVDQQVRDTLVQFVEWRMANKERMFDAALVAKSEYQSGLRVLKYRYTDDQEADLKRDCTSAIATIMPAFLPAYMTPLYGV